MIEAQRLTRTFGPFRAVDRLTFSIGRGEVVGFLGPNGAGKTTTMRMLTTYLEPTSGRARIGDHDLLDEPLAVRKLVGYLPENVPIYPEMRVREYLEFRGRLRDLTRGERRKAVARVVERCRIGDVQGRVVGQLSRGYRQRVGLAEAMLHDPAVLILDEPTAGLDPIQIREVRDLIRALGDRHTVLLSTHIMQEVEATCDRVLMIVRGRIAIDDPVDRLRARRAIGLEVRGPLDAVLRAVGATAGVESVRVLDAPEAGSGRFEITPRGDADPREALARLVLDEGWGLLTLELRRSTLEDRFVEAVRDAAVDAGRGEVA